MTFAAYAENGIFYVFVEPAVDETKRCVVCVRNDEHTSFPLGLVDNDTDQESLETWVRRKLTKKMGASNIGRMEKIH